MLALAVVGTTLATKWSTQARAQKKELIRLRQGNELRDEHIYELRTELAKHGIKRPPTPPGLYDEPPAEEL